MTDYPDVYTDGFSLTAGQFGITLTLSRSEPTGEPGPHEEPRIVVARIRMTQALAEAIAETIHQASIIAPAKVKTFDAVGDGRRTLAAIVDWLRPATAREDR